MTPEDLRHRLGRAPGETALLFDFDGTIAPIVDDPATAEPIPGAMELLDGLARRFRRVAVVSGRPRSYLTPVLPPSVDISALYGLESREAGTERDHPEAAAWAAVIDDVASSATLPDGVGVETKGYSLTVHFRNAPAAEGEVGSWAEGVASSTGLLARPAKASVELHPPLEVDKGTVALELAAGCATVVFVGDDLGDLPAFAAMDHLADRGVDAFKVASGGIDLPPAVADAADLVIDGPAAVVELFAPLASS
ncbi:MAG: trehalose-phosphatase [Acidimicrobiales bacterium]|nr:trehalose-phosphatase [Acidimicrobiales bacterium]